MKWNNWSCFMFTSSAIIFYLVTALSVSSSSSTFISDGIFEFQASTHRSQPQAIKACPVNFEFKNYTIITSQCKGPNYPPNLCCAAFKEFACAYADELNGYATNDCASTMFSYINLYGHYPPGLFANECREGKEGLTYPAPLPSTSVNARASLNASASANARGTYLDYNPLSLLMITTGFLVLSFLVFSFVKVTIPVTMKAKM